MNVIMNSKEQQEKALPRLVLSYEGKSIEFRKRIVEVGRNPTADFFCAPLYCARMQASFIANGKAWYIMALGAKGGTFLNGTRLEERLPYAIKAGDEICFSRVVTVTVQVAEP